MSANMGRSVRAMWARSRQTALVKLRRAADRATQGVVRFNVRLLGSISLVSVDGDAAPLGAASRLILAQLLLSKGRQATDDRLMDSLWGEAPAADSALRVAITRLRKQLAGTEFGIERAPAGYRLVGPGTCDSDELNRLEHDLANATSPADGVPIAVEALALWTGPALADVRLAPGGGRLAGMLDRRRAALRRRLASDLLQCDRLGEFVWEMEAWSTDDPLDETAAAAFARALAASGQVAAGLRHVNATFRSLTEVGLQPTAELRRCEADLLGDEQVGSAVRVQAGIPDGVAVHQARSLHGRSRELAVLTNEWSCVNRERRLAVVRLVGASGMGKSAIAAKFAEVAHHDGADVVWVAADPELQHPFRAIEQLMGQLGDEIDLRPTDFPDSDPRRVREALIDRACSSLVEALRDRQVIVVFDDVQWLDELSSAALERLLRSAVPERVMVVLIERDAAVARVEHSQVLEVRVQPLDRAAVMAWGGSRPPSLGG